MQTYCGIDCGTTNMGVSIIEYDQEALKTAANFAAAAANAATFAEIAQNLRQLSAALARVIRIKFADKICMTRGETMAEGIYQLNRTAIFYREMEKLMTGLDAVCIEGQPAFNSWTIANLECCKLYFHIRHPAVPVTVVHPSAKKRVCLGGADTDYKGHKKHLKSYQRNKSHSKLNYRLFLKTFGYPIPRATKLDDVADAFWYALHCIKLADGKIE